MILSFWLIGFAGSFFIIEMILPAMAHSSPPSQTKRGGYLNFPGGRPSYAGAYSVLYLTKT